MKIKSNKMKNHKKKYRLERIIRIQSAFHKIPDFWGLFKMFLARPPMPTTENTIRLDGPSINQFINLRLWDSMPTTSDSSMKKGRHLRIAPLSLPCSMALKPYLSPLLQSLSKSNHQHTHTSTSLETFSIYRWNSDNSSKAGAPRIPDRPEKALGKCSWKNFSLSLSDENVKN